MGNNGLLSNHIKGTDEEIQTCEVNPSKDTNSVFPFLLLLILAYFNFQENPGPQNTVVQGKMRGGLPETI